MAKQRKHTFTITVTFDKSCTAAHALREVKDTIHGEFYPTQRDDSEPGSYRVSKFGRVKVSLPPSNIRPVSVRGLVHQTTEFSSAD